jgi:phage baseplate assembly protein W
MTSRKIYDFSSVGESFEDSAKYAQSIITDFPLSIATPIRFSKANDGLFEMHFDLADQIRDNFKNMLATNHGERLLLSDFGANLRKLAYELGNENADAMAIRQISQTTQKYMPYISLETFESSRFALDENDMYEYVKIRVVYSIPTLRLNNQIIDLTFPTR